MEQERVYLVASGYEWTCPECGHDNREDSVPVTLDVTCDSCGETFPVIDWGHAI